MFGRLLPAATTILFLLGAGCACAQAPGGVVPAPTPALATTFGDEPGALRLPEALAIAPNGDLLVGDHFSGRVQRFREGNYVSRRRRPAAASP